jgi:poly-gamma-glutamate synthase PgsB/CapB
VITNVRYDHIFEMGESLEEIAQSLSNTIPENGVLFTADEAFFPYFRKIAKSMNTEVVLCRENEFTSNENEAIACTLGEKIGIPADSFPSHISNYQEDFGAHKMYETEAGQFLNLFSANDPQSTRKLLDQFFGDTSHVALLYNNRTDRPERLLLFIRYFFPLVPCRKIIVMGEARSLAVRLLKKHGFSNIISVSSWQDAVAQSAGSPLVGIGNIKGQAYEMVTHYEGGEQN